VIGIVGAGITGLALGVLLAERGVPFRILESGERAGGVIRSSTVEDRVLDHGPQRTRMTPPVARMIRRMGLDGSVVSVPPGLPLFILRDGRLRRVPFTGGDLLRTDLLSGAGKLRLLREPFSRGHRRDETVGAFLTRKFGREAYEHVLGPLFGGLYASDPGEMYVRHSLAETMKGLGVGRSLLWAFLRGSLDRGAAPPAVSFQGGMADLTDAMWERVRDQVSVGAPATALRRSGASGWTLHTGDGEAVPCTQVVLTLEAAGAAGLLQEEAPAAAERLLRLRYNRLALVHLAGGRALEGLGYQVSYGEGIRTRGVTWNAMALGRGDVYTAFLGGARDPTALELGDEALGEIARREFRAATACDARVLGVSRTRIPSWDRSWVALDGLALPGGVHLCSNYESRVGIPGRLARAEAMADLLAGGPPPGESLAGGFPPDDSRGAGPPEPQGPTPPSPPGTVPPPPAEGS
jgi:protoporphyrinogen/coproporphyrinogen III oxidase